MLDIFKEVFIEEEYQFPRHIGTSDILFYRNKVLESIEKGGSDSKFSRDFRKKLWDRLVYDLYDKRPFKFIREFPIEITDKDRWLRILKEFGLSGNKKYTDTAFFSLDYFFKYTGLVVEIDSSLHDKIYDAARDEYLRITYGLETIRIQGFSKDLDIENFIGRSLEIFNNKVKKSSIVSIFERRVSNKTCDIINNIIEIGYINFYKSREIVLNREDFYRKYGNNSDLSSFNSFVLEFEENFRRLYFKTIKWI
jgi:very-short-patch-repair endonuclease